MTRLTVGADPTIPPVVDAVTPIESTQVENDFFAVAAVVGPPQISAPQFQFSNSVQDNKMPSSKDSLTSKDNPVHTTVTGTKGEATIVFDNPGVAAQSVAAGGKQVTPSLIHKNPT